MTRERECMGFEEGWFVFSMGDSLKIVDLADNVLMVKLDSDGVAYVDCFLNDRLWGIDGNQELQNAVTAVYADYMADNAPHAAAAQSRLDAGKEFAPGYRVMVAVSPQNRRMVAKGGRDGVTQYDEDWHNHAQDTEVERQRQMDATRGM